MPFYKDTNNQLHFLDDVAHENLLSAGCIQISDSEAEDLQKPTPPTTEQIIAKYESELDAHLDAVAQSYRYRDRITFALRAGYPGPYQAEGIAFGAWMDTCNAQAYALVARVKAGSEAMPSLEAFITSLPEFVLP